MSQRQKDNRNLRLEWETQFVALCLVTELNHKKK
jgi:hypothetical protein